jgi:sporulation protein YqfC
MNKHSKPTTNKIIKTLDLPQDLFLGLSNISLSGNREIYISNHRGILNYGQKEMVILLKDYQFQIKGKNLCIISYTKDELTIQGYIHSMEFV